MVNAAELTYFDDELGGRWGREGKLEFLDDVEIACFRYADGRDFGRKVVGSHNAHIQVRDGEVGCLRRPMGSILDAGGLRNVFYTRRCGASWLLSLSVGIVPLRDYGRSTKE